MRECRTQCGPPERCLNRGAPGRQPPCVRCVVCACDRDRRRYLADTCDISGLLKVLGSS